MRRYRNGDKVQAIALFHEASDGSHCPRAWAFLGTLLVNAVADNDYGLLQAIFMLITFAVLAANLIADFVYVFLDPRIRQGA